MARIRYFQQNENINIGTGLANYPITSVGPSGSSVFMGQLAQTTASLGVSAMRYGTNLQEKEKQARNRQTEDETSSAQVDFLTQLDTQYNDYITNTEFKDFESYTTDAKTKFDTLLNNSANKITDARAKQDFINRMRIAKEAQYVDRIASNGRNLSEEQFKTKASTELNQINSLLQNPNSFLSYDEAVTNLADSIEKYSKNQKVDDEVKNAFFKEKQLEMILSYSQGQIEKNPIAFKKLLLGDQQAFLQSLTPDFENKGNIDLYNRPKVTNKDGSISTVASMSFNEDGQEILIPTISAKGDILTPEAAIKEYHTTGQYLGKFKTKKEATEYATKLHNQQATIYDQGVLNKFFESEYAPIFSKELTAAVRQKLILATENKIAELRSAAEKELKEQAIIEKEMFDKNNELNLMSIENEGKPIQSNYIPKVVNSNTNLLGDKFALIDKTAKAIGVDPVLFLSMLQQESGARHKDRNGKIIMSPAGAIGIGQLMPGTAKGLKVDPYNEEQNLIGAAKYLKQQLKSFGGDINSAIAAYNAGPGAVKKYKGIPPYKETQNYVKSVTALYNKNLKQYGGTIATSQMQEDAYKIELKATGSHAKALVAMMEQQEKETDAQLTFEVSQNIGGLYSEQELKSFISNFSATVNGLKNSDPRKPLLLDKLKIADDMVTKKINELKQDPAAYTDKYYKLPSTLQGPQKYDARKTRQLSLGLADGAVKVLTKDEENYFIGNIADQLTPDAKIETIKGLREIVGEANYGLAIRQLANKDKTLHSAYWMLPQLEKVNRQASIDIVNALKFFDTNDMKDINKQNEIVDSDMLLAVNSKLQPLIGPNMLIADPNAAKMFRDTAHLLGRYYTMTSKNAKMTDIAKQVEKILLNDSYDIVNSGWFDNKSFRDILVSKQAGFDSTKVQQLLDTYNNIKFDKNEILFLDDVVQVEMEIGQQIYNEHRELYNNNFLDIVNKNLIYIPTVTGTGVYLGYDSPTLNRPMLLFNKDKKPIYLDFNTGLQFMKDIVITPTSFTPTNAPVGMTALPALMSSSNEEEVIRKLRKFKKK